MPDQSSIVDRAAFEPKDTPLRDDVRRLGRLLGRLLRELGPPDLYDRVEGARRAAIRRRAEDESAETELADALTELQPALALEIARAFSAYFGLVNLAEQVHRLRRRRAYEDEGRPQPGGLRAVLSELAARGLDRNALASVLSEIVVEPVLTAHPTEALRRTLLTKELRMARALLDRGDASGARQAEAMRRVRDEVAAAWQTEEHLSVRPSVADEREHALFFLTEGVWRAVPNLRRSLSDALVRAYGHDAARDANRVRVSFATWIGGDMDGNPAVGPDTLRASLARQSELVLNRYVEALRELFRRLSQSRTRVAFTAAFEERLARYASRFSETTDAIPKRYAEMPYRVFLWHLSARVEATRDSGAAAYSDPRELIEDLELVAESLAAHAGRYAGLEGVRDLVELVRCFGFHLATLDVRQDALVHRRAVGELLGDSGFAELDRDARTAAVEQALGKEVTASEIELTESTERQIEVLRAFKSERERLGPDATGLYVISMAQGPDDALAVLLLARTAGLVSSAGDVPLDVAPLFETVDDLQTARATMDTLYDSPVYRRHLEARGKRQWVMLGYSDSNKTSGLIPSRVALIRAQASLVETSAAHGIELRFFHGRGGSVSRGGAKPREAVLASPRHALGGHLRVTEQGEIIRAKYGLSGIAERTLELLMGATIERTAGDGPELFQSGSLPSAESEALLDDVAKRARDAYRKLLNDDADFLPYFQNATPIDVIERLGLGSRPSRRREMRGVEDLRAIPWVFSWTQSRHLFPGWYGAGSALQAVIAEQGVAGLRQLLAESAAFRGMLGDIEMVLAKSDMGIARRYAELDGERGARVFAHLNDEWERTKATLLDVIESRELLSNDSVLRRAIRLRNPYIDPMSYLQVDLLARWRAKDRDDEELERALFGTVHGIARGLQNTG